MDPMLAVTAHRPFPLPSQRWIMRQRWHDLLFAHWPIPREAMRLLLPAPLQPFLDNFAGSAWLGVVPFWMSGVKFRGLPAAPGMSEFAEINVRTYLTIEGQPGVYFFSLDAESRLAVYGARLGFKLNYFYAKMSVSGRGDARIRYSSRRLASPRPAIFKAEYGPSSAGNFNPQPGSFEYFATERYCLYTAGSSGRIWRGNIHHLPWELQPAWARIEANSVAQALGISLSQASPHLHFARAREVLIWAPGLVC